MTERKMGFFEWFVKTRYSEHCYNRLFGTEELREETLKTAHEIIKERIEDDI
jgi:hypothetical protein